MPLSVKDELAALRNRGVVKRQQKFSSSYGVAAKTPESYAKLVQDNQAALKRKDSMHAGGVGMETQYFLERNREKSGTSSTTKVTEIPSSHYMYCSPSSSTPKNSDTRDTNNEERGGNTRSSSPVKRAKQPRPRPKSNNDEAAASGPNSTATITASQINKNDEAANMQDAAQHDIETNERQNEYDVRTLTPEKEHVNQQSPPRVRLDHDDQTTDAATISRMKEEEPCATNDAAQHITQDDDANTPAQHVKQQQSLPRVMLDHDENDQTRMKEEEEACATDEHDAAQHSGKDGGSAPEKPKDVETNNDETNIDTTEEPASSDEGSGDASDADFDEEASLDTTLTNDDDDDDETSSVDKPREPTSHNDEVTIKRTLRRTKSGREYYFDADGFRIFWA